MMFKVYRHGIKLTEVASIIDVREGGTHVKVRPIGQVRSANLQAKDYPDLWMDNLVVWHGDLRVLLNRDWTKFYRNYPNGQTHARYVLWKDTVLPALRRLQYRWRFFATQDAVVANRLPSTVRTEAFACADFSARYTYEY